MPVEINQIIGFSILALIIGMQLIVIWALEEMKRRDS